MGTTPVRRNLITDIPGLRVGHAQDPGLASGVTALVFAEPVGAAVAVRDALMRAAKSNRRQQTAMHMSTEIPR